MCSAMLAIAATVIMAGFPARESVEASAAEALHADEGRDVATSTEQQSSGSADLDCSSSEPASQECSERLCFQGLEHFHRQDYQQALRLFEQAAAQKPKPFPMAEYYLGLAHLKLGDYRQSVAHLRGFVDRRKDRPGYVDALIDLSVAHFQLKEYRQALERLNEANRVAPQNGFVLYYEGLCLYHLGAHPDAITSLQKAADLSQNTISRLELSWSARLKGEPRPGKDRKPPTRLAQARRVQAQSQYYTGLAYRAQKNLPQAIKAFRAAATSAVGTQLARHALELAEAASVGKRLNRRWALRLGVGAGRNSNVTLTPGGDASRPEFPSGASDLAFTFSVNGRVDAWQKASSYLSIYGDFYQTLYPDFRFADQQASLLRFDLGFRPSKRLSVGLESGFNYYRLGGEPSLREWFWNPYLGIFTGGRGYSRIFYRQFVQDFRQTQVDLRDGRIVQTGLRHYYLFNGDDFRKYLFVEALYHSDSTDTPFQPLSFFPDFFSIAQNFNYSGYRIEGGFRTPLTSQRTILEASYRFATYDYDFPTGFGASRVDHESRIIGVLRRRLSPRIEVSFNYFLTINNSGVADVEYTRNLFAGRVEFSF